MLNVVAPSNKEAWIRSKELIIFFKLPFYNKRLVDTTRSGSVFTTLHFLRNL
jgi:hypothetical protein